MTRLRSRVALLLPAVLVAVLFTTAAPAPAAFPGENGEIVYASRAVEAQYNNSGLVIVSADWKKQRLLPGKGVDDQWPSWSPDGLKVAFAARATNDDKNLDIYVVDANGKGLRPLTNTPFEDSQPSWSHDGSQIAYTHRDSLNGRRQIWLVSADGTGAPRALKPTGDEASDPAWSPDGRWITYTRRTASTAEGQVVVVASDGKGPEIPLTSNDSNYGADWAPDGKSIAYVNHHVEVTTSPSGTCCDSTDPSDSSDADNSDSDSDEWSDANHRPRQPPNNQQPETRTTENIYILDLPSLPARPSAEPRRLTDDGLYKAPLAWSPKGDKIVYGRANSDGRTTELYLINTIGRPQIFQLTNDQKTYKYGVDWQPARADIRIDPPSINFGKVNGDTTPSQPVKVTSTGTAPLRIETVVVEGAEFAVASDRCSNVTLERDRSCEIQVRFAPVTDGPKSGTVIINSNAAAKPKIPLNGERATLGPPVIQFEPDDLAFGQVPLGLRPLKTVTVKNLGEQTLNISSVGLLGGSKDAFAITLDECKGRGLGADQYCRVTVAFTASRFESRSSLVVRSNAKNDPFVIDVTGGPPPRQGDEFWYLLVSPPDIAFGRPDLNTSSEPSAITVTNEGNVPVTVSTSLEGAQAGEFELVVDRCNGVALDGNASCQLQVSFAPRTSGPKTASVVINGSDSRGRTTGHLVSLLGETAGGGPGPEDPDLRLTVEPAIGPPGFVTLARGEGFEPGGRVKVRWEPGLGEQEVNVDDRGGFEVAVLVLHRDQLGHRELVATVVDRGSGTARAGFLVVPSPLQPATSRPMRLTIRR